MRFRIDWASLLVGRKFIVFALFFFVFEGNFQVQLPPTQGGGGDDLKKGFLLYEFGVLYMDGLIFGLGSFVIERNFG